MAVFPLLSVAGLSTATFVKAERDNLDITHTRENRERQTNSQTDRDRERQRQKESKQTSKQTSQSLSNEPQKGGFH